MDEAHRWWPFDTKLDKSLDRYREYVEATAGERATEIEIEEFCTYLDYQHSFLLRGGDTWSSDGNEDQLMLRWLIGRVLHHATPAAGALPSQYLAFAGLVKPGDLIISFNYDLVVERALEAAGVPYRRFPFRVSEDYGSHQTLDDPRDDHEVVVLKMHGSIDWVSDRHHAEVRRHFVERGLDIPDHDPVFGEAPASRLEPLCRDGRSSDDPLSNVHVLLDLDDYYGSRGSDLTPPLLLAPSHVKPLYASELRSFWSGLASHAYGWGGLVIIGYKLASADEYVKVALHELASGYVTSFYDEGWKICDKDRIKLVDLRTTTDARRDLLDTYRFLDLGHTELILDGFTPEAVEAVFRP